jgi:hypothetical protein
MCRPSHSHLRYHPNDILWGLKIMKLLTVQFSPVPCHLLPLSSKIFLSTLCSNTLNLWPTCNVTGQVSHWHKATTEIMVLCTLIFILLYSRLEDKQFYAKWSQASPKFNLLLTSSRRTFSFVKMSSKNISTFLHSQRSQYHLQIFHRTFGGLDNTHARTPHTRTQTQTHTYTHHTHTHTYTHHTHTHTQAHTHHIHRYTHTHTTYTDIHTHTHTTYTHIHKQTHTHTHTHKRLHC